MKWRSFIQLHLSVFLFSFTAILGDIIQLPLVSLVWWRVVLTLLVLALILGPRKLLVNFGRQAWLRHFFIGILIAIHWLAFYGSIKLSNASIVLIAVSTSSFITALIEPLIIKTSKWRTVDLVLSLLVIPAMVLIYFNASEMQQTGLWVGLIASFMGAVFSIYNKMWIIEGKEMEITFVQQATVAVSLGAMLLIFSLIGHEQQFVLPSGIDWFYLFVFAAICTVLAYYLYLRALHWLSAFDISFAFNMEPVYGLILAVLILADHQEISLKIYLGMAFILLMVLLHTLLKARGKRNRLTR
jgi:drug/metabolite transporter (DMT)-like permease